MSEIVIILPSRIKSKETFLVNKKNNYALI